jgi:hypothetical protein
MGIYAEPVLLDWFVSEFPKHSKSKLDMGKSCIRFKKMNDIPYELIGQLASKMTTEDWINKYESAFVKMIEIVKCKSEDLDIVQKNSF